MTWFSEDGQETTQSSADRQKAARFSEDGQKNMLRRGQAENTGQWGQTENDMVQRGQTENNWNQRRQRRDWPTRMCLHHSLDQPVSCLEQMDRLTCMCLQSCPLAGSWIRIQVIGHLRGTLIAVCSTPSSPLIVELFVTLEKFLLTVKRKTKSTESQQGIKKY